MRILKNPDALQHGPLAHLRHRGEAAGELAYHLALERPQLLQIDARLAEGDAVRRELARGVHHRCSMQQRLGGDAAYIQADSAEGRIALDEDCLQAEVGSAKSRRVAADARAQYQNVAFKVGGDRS